MPGMADDTYPLLSAQVTIIGLLSLITLLKAQPFFIVSLPAPSFRRNVPCKTF